MAKVPGLVVVVPTSDEPTLMRREAVYLTLAIAEYFRNLARGRSLSKSQ
jgi:flagellar biosynthesis/type III secretory pathway ATPase